MNLWIVLITLVAGAAAKTFTLKVQHNVDQKCQNQATASDKALWIRGFRLIVYEKDGNWGKVTGTLIASIPKGNKEDTWKLRAGGTLTVTNDIDEKKRPDLVKALEGATTNNVQLYIYVDDNSQKTPLNFGAPNLIYDRSGGYGKPEENPYHDTPVRIRSVEVQIGHDNKWNTVIAHQKYDSPGPDNCKESTTNWLVRAGIYRLSACADTIACQKLQWDTTYFDPYDGYVRI